MNKHEAVWEWLKGCPHIKDMFFAFGLVESGATQLVPREIELNTFIDGTKRMRYIASLIRFATLSQEPNDENNIFDLVDFEKVADWVETKSRNEEFPEFPDNYVVEEVSVLPNAAGFSFSQDMTKAKYTLEFQIDYTRSVVTE